MVRKVVILFLGLLCSVSITQSQEMRDGLIRAGLGLRLGNSAVMSGFYAGGGLEYYLDDRISIEGEGNYYLGHLGDSINYSVVNNHSLLAGPNIHFLRSTGFDPYAGVMVGAAFTEMNPLDHEPGSPCYEKLQADPLVAFQLGFNYFTEKYFHMFMEGGYALQKHTTAANPSMNLNELSFKFGLGIHVGWFCKKESPQSDQ